MKQTIQTDENGTEITTVHLWRGLHPGAVHIYISCTDLDEIMFFI